MNKIKPMLAADFDEDKLQFPVYMQQKIDGVRAINIDGNITGRSLKPFKNRHIADKFSGEDTEGFDGELALGSSTSPTLCGDTTGFVNRITAKDGKPVESDELVWWVFDYVGEEAIGLSYTTRFLMLRDKVERLGRSDVRCVYTTEAADMRDVETFEAESLDAGYEGVILRAMDAPYKCGRSTLKAGQLLRIKRFIDFEAVVHGVSCAKENTNEAVTNELGRSERSTHKEKMVDKDMVGSLQAIILKDVIYRGDVILKAGTLIDVGPGTMTHAERSSYWKDKSLIVGKVIKVKVFGHGTKDLPRFPTFLGFRVAEDM